MQFRPKDKCPFVNMASLLFITRPNIVAGTKQKKGFDKGTCRRGTELLKPKGITLVGDFKVFFRPD